MGQIIDLSHELLGQMAENLNISVCLGFFFFFCFGSNTEIPEKEGQETEGAPAAVRVHFFTTSI